MPNLASQFKLINVAGREIHPGDRINSFRGDLAVYNYITQGSGPGTSGKIYVTWLKNNTSGEYYPSGFNVAIVKI